MALRKAIGGEKAGIEGDKALNAGSGCRDEALHTEFSQFI